LNSAVSWSKVSLLNTMSLLLAAKAASSQRADTQFNLQTRKPGAQLLSKSLIKLGPGFRRDDGESMIQGFLKAVCDAQLPVKIAGTGTGKLAPVAMTDVSAENLAFRAG
jgi:hypothetical protein